MHRKSHLKGWLYFLVLLFCHYELLYSGALVCVIKNKGPEIKCIKCVNSEIIAVQRSQDVDKLIVNSFLKCINSNLLPQQAFTEPGNALADLYTF